MCFSCSAEQNFHCSRDGRAAGWEREGHSWGWRWEKGIKAPRLNHPHRNQWPQQDSGAGTAITTHTGNKTALERQNWGVEMLWKEPSLRWATGWQKPLGFFRHRVKKNQPKGYRATQLMLLQQRTWSCNHSKAACEDNQISAYSTQLSSLFTLMKRHFEG